MIRTIGKNYHNADGSEGYHSESYCKCDKCGKEILLGKNLWNWEIVDASMELVNRGWYIPLNGKTYCEECRPQLTGTNLRDWAHKHGREYEGL